MKIGIVVGPYSPVPPKTYGPIEELVGDLIKGLAELGHEVILFASGDSEVGCELIPICPRSYPVASDFTDDIRFWKLRRQAEAKTYEVLKKNLCRLDIIHSFEVDLLNFADFPNLTTTSGPFNFYNADYYSERKDKLFFVNISNAQKRDLLKMNFVGTIYYGLDAGKFEFCEKPEDYLLFLGRISQEKGTHLALELAVKKGARIKLAGISMHMDKEYFEKKVRQFLAYEPLEFFGEVGLKEKNELYKNAACNLHMIENFREPFGLTIIEAAYCGTPTLAIKKGSMPELIENGKSGILVEDMMEALYRLEEYRNLDRRYIATRARQLFNYRIMARQYVMAYKKVLEIYKKNLQQNKGMLNTFLKDSQREIFQLWERSARPELQLKNLQFTRALPEEK